MSPKSPRQAAPPKPTPAARRRGPSFAELFEGGPALPPAPVVADPSKLTAASKTTRVSAAPEVLHLEQEGECAEALAPGTPTRVLSDLKRGRLRPEVTLDVHGLTTSQAIRTLDSLLDGASDSNVRTLLVVHGRGLHSGPGGPVLGEAIVEHLTRLRATRVLALCSAPSRWGGAGALLIRLRRSS